MVSHVPHLCHHQHRCMRHQALLTGLDGTHQVAVAGVGGAVVTQGKRVGVHATGTLARTGVKFWSTKESGPFVFTAGMGKVIRGWDQGCLGMSLGEKRILDIPAQEAYGVSGFPAWGIPPDSDLRFEIQVVSIQ